MQDERNILLLIAVSLLAGKMAGQVSQRLGMPTVVGKIILGLIAGPAVLGLLGDNATIEVLSEIGVIILMFLAGMETDMDTMKKVSLPAFAVASGGVLLPFLGGIGIGYAFHLPTHEILFVAAILTATSVSISAQTLRELGLLQSREGTTVLAAAIIDDVMGVIILSFVFAMTGAGDPAVSVLKMAVFLPVSFVVGHYLTRMIASRADDYISNEAQLSLVIAFALIYAWAAERLAGVAAVTGAYMAGLLIARTRLLQNVADGVNWVAYGFFVPLFFVAIGLKADFGSLASNPGLVASLMVVAMLGKIIGCYVPARLTGSNHHEAGIVGIGMMSRGEVALVIASAGLAANAIGDEVFSATILMTLVTTVATPIMLKLYHTRSHPVQATAADEHTTSNGYAVAER
jgi:Kef-type K+ transport system membrane component KefB